MKKTRIILFLCFLDVMILSVGYAMQITPVVYAALIGFAAIIVFNTDEYLLPVVLFFLPWDNILKVSADSYTVFTLCLPIVFIAFLLKNSHKEGLIDATNLLLVLLFSSVTLITKSLQNCEISGSYIQFLFMLVFIPMYLKVYIDKINFSACIVFLGVGAILASATAKILMEYSHMREFIIFEEWRAVGLLRLSGFYGDSNFYSVHFIIAIAGMLFLISKCRSNFKISAEIAFVVVLIYYGMVSVSKTFIICLLLIMIIWVCGFLIGRKRISKKIVLLIGIFAFISFLTISNIFADQINYYLVRFGMVTSTNTLTTGRLDLWIDYLDYIFSDFYVFMFGNGYTDVRLSLFWNDTHNTIIQMLYQVGVVGLIIIGIWAAKLLSSVHLDRGISFEDRIYNIMLLIALFLTWGSLDMLYFNEFFFTFALYLVFKKYINNESALVERDEIVFTRDSNRLE